jgi:hypothetical protein
MSEVETMILRFRDLSTPDGKTVERHSDIARGPEGYVWWGWWAKGGERVPTELFGELLAKAQRPEGLLLYFLDSGHGVLYRATCRGIEWNPVAGKLRPSPEPAKTPEYYSTEEQLAWFKLGPIERCDLELTEFTYVRVDAFFTSQPSLYKLFYGKRIFSAQELIQQNRSIWFVRRAQPSDPRHQVSLLDGPSLSPENFPKNFIQSESRSLLWLSDLHFSEGEHNYHAFPLDPKHVSRLSLDRALKEALKRHYNDDPRLGGVIISGDITWKAAPREFEQARAFIDRTMSWADVKPFYFSLCPGNHDVAWSSQPATKEAQIEAARGKAQEAYAGFYTGLFNLTPSEHLSCGRRFLLGGTYPVEIVCLNSSVLEQWPGAFQGHGFVGHAQLEEVEREFGWSKQDAQSKSGDGQPFRIVVLHHHLVPVTYREQPDPQTIYSVVLDAEAVMRWVVQHRVDLVLHGHMHQPFCVKLSKPVSDHLEGEVKQWHDFHVIGMGSTGVKREHLGAEGQNTFGVLRFESSGVKVEVNSVTDTGQSKQLWSVQVPYRQH